MAQPKSIKAYKNIKLAQDLYEDLIELAPILDKQLNSLRRFKRFNSANRLICLLREEINIVNKDIKRLKITIDESREKL